MSRRLTTLGTATACAVALLAGGLSSAAPAAPDRSADRGSSGIGDPYFPRDGNGGIDVKKYSIHDRYDFDKGRLSGRTKLKIRATEDLDSFNLDLLLDVSNVRVDGRRAKFAKLGRHELRIEPRQAIEAGQKFTVVVRYAGFPGKLRYAGESNWLANRHEVVAMNEPHMAPWWFPANDHPLDKARYDFHITVPRGKQVIANGLPKMKRSRGNLTTSTWSATEPMASYLAFFAAGDFTVARGTDDGLPWLVAVSQQLPKGSANEAMNWLKRTPRIVSWLESELGDYPFKSTGGLVTSLDVGFALENQTRPTYPYIGSGGGNWLLVHELAHQWFGDSVSIQGWRDIWLNEGFATYMEVRYAETHRSGTAASWLRRNYDWYSPHDSIWGLQLAEPGSKHIFDQAVYERGGMALVALRNVIGDDDFEALLREWVADNFNGNATTADFTELAEQISGQDLDDFFAAWLYSAGKPADTAANGLG